MVNLGMLCHSNEHLTMIIKGCQDIVRGSFTPAPGRRNSVELVPASYIQSVSVRTETQRQIYNNVK